MKRATIIRWTGQGSLARLAGSVEYLLRTRKVMAEVSRIGSSVVVRGPEPLSAAAHLQNLPGIAWIAAGYAEGSMGDLTHAGGSLAKLYLRAKDGFSVEAEATGGVLASDVGGSVTSSILESVHGARVSESPKVKFRVAADGPKGAIGVEVKVGVGGAAMGDKSVVCLVSGGVHSSVTAWMAVLAGLRVSLVHARTGEESLLGVARLYSELSNRSDPRGLKLEVVEGESVPGALARYAGQTGGEVFGGFSAGGVAVPAALRGKVSAPLYLVPEERFSSEFAALGIRAFHDHVDWREQGPSKFRSKRFAGGPADVSGVLDGLR